MSANQNAHTTFFLFYSSTFRLNKIFFKNTPVLNVLPFSRCFKTGELKLICDVINEIYETKYISPEKKAGKIHPIFRRISSYNTWLYSWVKFQ